ncbi:hypothetical protein Pcinc_011682 [Petrolisthes cinctipes]|uniref:RFX-type winged-helix domain-containing protein n=1 Tax=Petrolisthes cinctipes TaxID=88211 RepID=A0AAE1G6B7_PETCI|nr:hypothetical protein Pcinc_011682 [Petrolisthes cinctipes]
MSANKKESLGEAIGVNKFLMSHCTVTHEATDLIPTDTLYEVFNRFCRIHSHPTASKIFMGRLLGKIGVRAKARIGGTRGKGQKTCYVGLQCDLLQDTLVSSDQENPSFTHHYPATTELNKKRKPDTKEMEVFEKFVVRYYNVTRNTSDEVLQEDFYNFYKQYCLVYDYPLTTDTNIKKFLKKLGVLVTVDRRQEMCKYIGMKNYVKLVPDDLSPDSHTTSSLALPSLLLHEFEDFCATSLTQPDPTLTKIVPASPVSMSDINFDSPLSSISVLHFLSPDELLHTTIDTSCQSLTQQLPPHFPFLLMPEVLVDFLRN